MATLVLADAFSVRCLRRSVLWQTGSRGLAGAASCEVHICGAPCGGNAPGGEARVHGSQASLGRAGSVPVRLAALTVPASPGACLSLAGVAAGACSHPVRG